MRTDKARAGPHALPSASDGGFMSAPLEIKQHTEFTKQEAQSKVGYKVKSGSRYAYVPEGTSGLVKKVKKLFREFSVLIEWDYGERGQCRSDCFLKAEYNRWVTEQGQPPRTKSRRQNGRKCGVGR
jgi:hypothetical protein